MHISMCEKKNDFLDNWRPYLYLSDDEIKILIGLFLSQELNP